MGKYTRQPSRLGAALCTPLYHRFWILSVPQNPRLGDKPEKIFKKPEKTPQIHERLFYFWRSCP